MRLFSEGVTIALKPEENVMAGGAQKVGFGLNWRNHFSDAIESIEVG